MYVRIQEHIYIYTSEQEPIVCRELLFKLYRILYSVPSLRSRFIFIQHSRHHDQVQHSRHLNLDCTNFSLSVSLYLVSRELYIQKYTSTTVTPKEKQTQEPNRSNSITLFEDIGPTQFNGGSVGFNDNVFALEDLALSGGDLFIHDFTDGFGTVTPTPDEGFAVHIAIECSAFGGGKITCPRT